VGTLHGRGEQRDVVHPVVAPVVVDRLARPVAAEQLEALIKPFREHGGIGRISEAAEFVLDRSTEARREGHPSATQ
jgi:hypothetical protein